MTQSEVLWGSKQTWRNNFGEKKAGKHFVRQMAHSGDLSGFQSLPDLAHTQYHSTEPGRAGDEKKSAV